VAHEKAGEKRNTAAAAAAAAGIVSVKVISGDSQWRNQSSGVINVRKWRKRNQ
jgi:hypothetical protein